MKNERNNLRVYNIMRKTKMSKIRTFLMHRMADESGVSGAGIVLEGVEFTDGKVIVSWLGKYSSLGVYPSFSEFSKIHIDSHPTNDTAILWDAAGEHLSDLPQKYSVLDEVVIPKANELWENEE